MFMPLYFPSREPLRVVIVGGGYAGLAALVTLRERRPDAELTLVDPRDHHLKITHLHETFRRPLDDLRLPFTVLEKRFDIRHVQAELPFDAGQVSSWAAAGALTVGDEVLPFDYLLWATGAGYRRLMPSEHCLDLLDFMQTPGPELLARTVSRSPLAEPVISVVGSGATGIQFLFEITDHLRRCGLSWRLRLVDAGDAPLGQFNPKLGRYVASRLQAFGIDYLPHHYCRGQTQAEIELEQADTGERLCLPSSAALLFVGMNPEPRLQANAFGQVRIDGKTLPRVFAAGDCAQYRLPGSNALSAQTALRKGRLAARNILRHASRFKLLEPYLHRDLGYVIGMGRDDAVGWLALEGNIVAGQPAALLKEVVEAQYDLLLAGMDTYIL